MNRKLTGVRRACDKPASGDVPFIVLTVKDKNAKTDFDAAIEQESR